MLFAPSKPRTKRPPALAAASLALALALAPASALAAEAVYATGGEGGRALDIAATVDAPEPVVIKVEVPSSASAVDVRIETSVIDGRFMGFAAAKGTIKNLPESAAPIDAAVVEVRDGAEGRARALDYVRVSLTGDRTVELSEGSGKSDVLVDGLEPGAERDLLVSVAGRAGAPGMPAGEYGMRATIKVSAG